MWSYNFYDMMLSTELLQHHMINLYIYILGLFIEKAYSELLERKVVYIPKPTSSHATDVSEVKINHGSLQSDWTSAQAWSRDT